MFKVLYAWAFEIPCYFSLNPEERSLGRLTFQMFLLRIETIILFSNILLLNFEHKQINFSFLEKNHSALKSFETTYIFGLYFDL
jgi:hypothetical protein